jgi:hypothetical protein
MEREKHPFGKEDLPPVTFESLDSFKKLIREHYNLAHSELEGTIEPNMLLAILRQIEDKVSLYWAKTTTFAHNSALEILVFPVNQFGGNMRFLGLATFYPDMLRKSCQEFNLSEEEIGLVDGRVMSRFGFSMFHDNSLRQEWVEKNYKLVSADELERVVNERRAELGLG